jgi:hypothetical protein
LDRIDSSFSLGCWILLQCQHFRSFSSLLAWISGGRMIRARRQCGNILDAKEA